MVVNRVKTLDSENFAWIGEQIEKKRRSNRKMITLESPHMGLNDTRAVNMVNMSVDVTVALTDNPGPIIETVAARARRARGGKFKNVVFNCHGLSSSLQMGSGFNRRHTILFTNLQGLVDKIWFYACEVASTVSPGARYVGGGPTPFCSEAARAAQCYVVAFTESQAIRERRNGRLPYGQLDTPEGLVRSYGPRGDVTWSHRYPSTYQRGNGTDYRNPD